MENPLEEQKKSRLHINVCGGQGGSHKGQTS